jgi:hypothetical protein
VSGETFPQEQRVLASHQPQVALRAVLIRASTPLFRTPKGLDAHGTGPWAEGPRDKPGQDEVLRPISALAIGDGLRECPPLRPPCSCAISTEKLPHSYVMCSPRNQTIRFGQHDGGFSISRDAGLSERNYSGNPA